LSDIIDNSIQTAIEFPDWKEQILKHLLLLQNTVGNLSSIYRNDANIVAKLEVIKLRLNLELLKKAIN
jgi:hypothetical protein